MRCRRKRATVLSTPAATQTAPEDKDPDMARRKPDTPNPLLREAPNRYAEPEQISNSLLALMAGIVAGFFFGVVATLLVT